MKLARYVAAIGFVLLAAGPVRAQAPESRPGAQPFTFASYLQRVAQGNLELAAQKTNVTIARAQIAIGKVFPDAQLTAGLLQYDVTQKNNPTATVVQLYVPLQLGGKRGARVAFAEAGVAVADAELEDFLRTLRAAAGNAYVDALHARLILDRKRRTLSSLEGLVSVNEQRLRAGDVGEVVLVQSRVELKQFEAQVLAGEGDVRTTDLAVVQLLGGGAQPLMGKPLDLQGDLRTTADRTFNTDELVAHAVAQRPDLKSAKKQVLLAQKQIDLVRANRVIDVTPGAMWQHNFSTSGTAPQPASDFLGGTLTVPLPFARIYKGDLDAAYAGEDQSRLLERAARVAVEVEVRQAIAQYEAAASRVRLYTRGVLSDADKVLDKTFYNYQRGGATLVEVLVAQRTVNDVYLSYYDALADAGHALVAVSQAAAKWDVQL
jgi:cobalt-zinc-cadmium efflux system outer membrane protein